MIIFNSRICIFKLDNVNKHRCDLFVQFFPAVISTILAHIPYPDLLASTPCRLHRWSDRASEWTTALRLHGCQPAPLWTSWRHYNDPPQHREDSQIVKTEKSRFLYVQHNASEKSCCNRNSQEPCDFVSVGHVTRSPATSMTSKTSEMWRLHIRVNISLLRVSLSDSARSANKWWQFILLNICLFGMPHVLNANFVLYMRFISLIHSCNSSLNMWLFILQSSLGYFSGLSSLMYSFIWP